VYFAVLLDSVRNGQAEILNVVPGQKRIISPRRFLISAANNKL
jgi:hypothetical protein